ncbi:MAG: ATP-dependent Clp protease ATP-binding subunit ClpX [Candidatus Shikimatogenerans bostrichidophilus]|nr:MAG: ATP-dependent Clp protease ATP-binding subunit ClpX [Candidatus Shikimatogenerans bostrichidophilus]
MNNNYCLICEGKKKLINYKNIYICNNCIKNINKRYYNKIKKKLNIFFYPKYINKILDKYVIGQKYTKKVLSVTIYNHYKRLIYNSDLNKNINIEKSNILIIGKTGTGKTLLAKTISKILNLPFVIVDATVFTEAGYVGEDVESILTRLLQVSNYNIKLAEKGIVYIDEFDKLSRKSKNPSITRDVSGEGVQQSLLKLFEDSTVYISPFIGRKHPEQNMIPIKTKNILFIVGGSFEGIEKIINYRIKKSNEIGYDSIIKRKKNINKNKTLKYINTKDLQEFGIIPEILGRLPIITYLNKLTKEDLKKILIKPRNSLIKQYIELLKLDNIKIIIKKSFIDIIVKKAIKLGLGARGLKVICEKIFKEITYNIDKKKERKKIIMNKKIVEFFFKKNE